MKGSHLAWLLFAMAALALVFQTQRATDRVLASHTLLRVEAETTASIARGRVDPTLLRTNLVRLKEAAEQDPVEVRIPIAVGTMHLLLQRPHEAVEAYRAALEVEERYEIYQNLAEAQRRAGDTPGARESLATALKLAPFLEAQARRAVQAAGEGDSP